MVRVAFWNCENFPVRGFTTDSDQTITKQLKKGEIYVYTDSVTGFAKEIQIKEDGDRYRVENYEKELVVLRGHFAFGWEVKIGTREGFLQTLRSREIMKELCALLTTQVSGVFLCEVNPMFFGVKVDDEDVLPDKTPKTPKWKCCVGNRVTGRPSDKFLYPSESSPSVRALTMRNRIIAVTNKAERYKEQYVMLGDFNQSSDDLEKGGIKLRDSGRLLSDTRLNFMRQVLHEYSIRRVDGSISRKGDVWIKCRDKGCNFIYTFRKVPAGKHFPEGVLIPETAVNTMQQNLIHWLLATPFVTGCDRKSIHNNPDDIVAKCKGLPHTQNKFDHVVSNVRHLKAHLNYKIKCPRGEICNNGATNDLSDHPILEVVSHETESVYQGPFEIFCAGFSDAKRQAIFFIGRKGEFELSWWETGNTFKVGVIHLDPNGGVPAFVPLSRKRKIQWVGYSKSMCHVEHKRSKVHFFGVHLTDPRALRRKERSEKKKKRKQQGGESKSQVSPLRF